MAIEKMALVNIAGVMDDLEETLEKCCESGCFHIEPAVSGGTLKGGLRLLGDKNPFAAPLKSFQSLASSMEINLEETDFSELEINLPDEFSKLAAEIENEYSDVNALRQKTRKEQSEYEEAVLQINHLKGLHSDFEKIFSCRHVAVRVGKLPVDNVQKLDYYNNNFFFVRFETGKTFCWGMYFCPVNDKDVVDGIFRSMYFERIRIPDFVKGNTDEALERLDKQISECREILDECEKKTKQAAEKYGKMILQAYSKLKYKYDIYEVRRKVGELHGKFYIKGFVPEKDFPKFEKLLSTIESVSAVKLPADADAACTPPTILKNKKLFKPFSMLVEMYGLPEYNGFNPTAFVAITYTLMFGIMFGDLGQGFLVVLLGIIVGKKFNKQMGGIMSRVGLSSMVFGTLYGSVFGFEDLLDPVYEAIGIDFLPLKVFRQTNFILLTAVAIGIALILMSMILNIYIGFKQKDYEKAIFGCNGIAGLIFYSSVVIGVVGTMLLDIKVMSAPFVIFLIVIPLVCIFCRTPFAIAVKYKEWRLSADEEKMTVGNFIVENFFEMFEFLLSYVSNTMSFLRVGGFVLSHAGMMLVVMTLMEGCAAAAQPLVLVLGNAFVMAMEGMIVAIQIIRLEFYEIFSRFYEGGGKPFEPIKTTFSAVE